ncbi:MAG: CPBP family glutamic-type intramembrane protease, partial [Bdellovibrionota bacterium]
MKRILCSSLILTLAFPSFALAEEDIDYAPLAHARVSAPLVGWGNLFVPGLGATLSGKPLRGLAEAGTELGLYYGGTFNVKEGRFGIDGSVKVPHSNSLKGPVLGQIMQETGLKYHFYNTFHHYQLAVMGSEKNREIDSLQPIYEGNMGDMLAAPFHWKNLNNAWALPVVAASTAFLLYSYKTTGVTQYKNFRVPQADEALFGFSQGIVIPVGGLIGEEPLFRGFLQREMRAYTNSVPASLILQSAAFTFFHPAELRLSAFASGIL